MPGIIAILISALCVAYAHQLLNQYIIVCRTFKYVVIIMFQVSSSCLCRDLPKRTTLFNGGSALVLLLLPPYRWLYLDRVVSWLDKYQRTLPACTSVAWTLIDVNQQRMKIVVLISSLTFVCIYIRGIMKQTRP
jgi:hypothetical protein